jgi:site-specific DNA-methyltransferase (cytosine-N4-specific)
MSTLPLKSLLAFQERAELVLCQEFICYNPARLPTPVEWVARKRIRVKDAFTRIWWLAATPHPKADNRRVLTQYSASMRKLLQKGTYNPGLRPSEHNIGKTSFLTQHAGAIPPNVVIPTPRDEQSDLFEVLPIANTGAGDPYQRFVRDNEFLAHPARMPAKLADFFINFLTEESDLVMDPFAGSNTTGAVAEALNRRWIAVEVNPDYIEGSRARFNTIRA